MRRMVTIAGTEETVLKPIVNTVAKDLLHILKLNNAEDFTVNYNGIPILKEYYSGSSTVDKSTFLHSSLLCANILIIYLIKIVSRNSGNGGCTLPFGS